ncbi:MAG: 3-dehydroquinate synthase [Candidatus Geothermincolia bacterium]
METIRLDLGARSYEIAVGRGAWTSLPELLAERFRAARIFVVSDSNVAKLYAARLAQDVPAAQPPLVIEAGEGAKNMETVTGLLTLLAQLGAGRQDVLLALGGGVVGDIAGFVAATYMRGISYVQLPTTLLAMVDSSIGGKVGVDLPFAKNAVGAFWQPAAVIADIETLATLPEPEYRAGWAEVAKYALVFDRELHEALLDAEDRIEAREISFLHEVVMRCAAIKAAVVAEDERDTGARMLLNYGHTFGHALESLTGYQVYSHGEAVALGMLMAAAYSEAAGIAAPGLVREHRSLLNALGLGAVKTSHDGGALRDLMRYDKKRTEVSRLVLLKDIAAPVIEEDADEAALLVAIETTLQGGR